MGIRKLLKKYKVKSKKLYTVIALTIIEMILIAWFNNWVVTPAILAPLIQFIAIFENRSVWAKLSEKEKEEITLSEDELDNFVKTLAKKLVDMPIDEILIEMKKDGK